MPISHAERLELECPRCGAPFSATVWVVVDGAERPDAVRQILDGNLHDVQCPHCGQAGEAPTPLLYHDGRAERVLLAVPADMAEDEWREAGQDLLWMLVGALPPAERASYLGTVQAEAGLAGIASVIRAEELAGSAPAGAGLETEPDSVPPLVLAMQALLAARGASELQQAMQRYPLLLEPQTVTILRELAHEAFKQGETEAGQGFSRAAEILNDLRESSRPDPMLAPAEEAAAGQAEPGGEPLDEIVFALLRSHSGPALVETVDAFPQLLDPAIDSELARWAGRARAEGKPRIADGLDERRDALQEMREQYEAQRPILEAVQALLEADSADDLEAALVDNDALYTDEADAILRRLEESADSESRPFVEERRALLARVRAALTTPEEGNGAEG